MKFTTDLHLMQKLRIIGSAPLIPFHEFLALTMNTVPVYLYLYLDHISIPCTAVSVTMHIHSSLSRFIARNFSVSLHLFIPQYLSLTFITCFSSLRYALIPLFPVQCTPISLHTVQRRSAHTLSCLFMCCPCYNIGHTDTILFIVSSDF
jgi:hypothetical protein